MNRITFFILTAALTLISCHRQTTNDQRPTTNHYAQGFSLEQTADGYTIIDIFDPWQKGKTMQRYYLIADSATIDIQPTDGIVVRTPIHRLAATSCTHVGFLDAIGETRSLCGICSPYMVYTPIPSVEEGCADLGDAMQVNPELVLLSNPEIVMISTYAQGDGARQYLEQANIPLIYNNEWTENSPLARAEWIRLIGAFFGKQDLADSIFAQVEQNYLELRNLTSTLPDSAKLSIMAGNNFRGTWYMPSGRVYTGQLYHDAGANYFYQSDTTNGSIPLSIETVLLNFQDADVWVNSTARTLSELADIDDKHTWFKAYQTARVYNFMRRTNNWANDFWESAVVRPDLLLADLINALYPELLPEHQPVYIEHLQ